jgi:glycosyltransferase involved in cell wall biosynthesis
VPKVDFAFIGGRGVFSNYGGVENATREIALELSKKYVNLLVYGVEGHVDNSFEPPHNLKGVATPSWIYNKLGQHGMILFCVLHAIFVSRPKVVYLFASGPCVFTPLLRLGGLNVVTSLRAIDSARDKWGVVSRNILRFGEYCAWRFSNSFTVNSKEMQKHYRSKREDVIFIPNGAKASCSNEEKLPNGIKKQEFFLFAARFDPVKRLHLLLEAYSLLEGENTPKLIIAGGNAKDLEYEKQLKAYECENIIFMGHLSATELAPLMNHCKAFILPSILEGMSNSLLSAMATGKPVLAADIPANSDVIEFPEALYKIDDIDALNNGLYRLATDDVFCSMLGTKLKKRADEYYSWESSTNSFYQLGLKYL